MKKKQRRIVWMLAGLLIICLLASFTLGRYPVPLKELFGILGQKFGIPVETFWSSAMETAVWKIRLPRVLLSVLVGASLASAGSAYQGVFQNPMAAPDILGASSGAAFGAALAILLDVGNSMIVVFAFLFSLLTVGTVIFIGGRARGKRTLGLILSGIMIGSLVSSGTTYIKLVADPQDQLPAIT